MSVTKSNSIKKLLIIIITYFHNFFKLNTQQEPVENVAWTTKGLQVIKHNIEWEDYEK